METIHESFLEVKERRDYPPREAWKMCGFPNTGLCFTQTSIVQKKVWTDDLHDAWGGSKNRETPQNGWFMMEHPKKKVDDLRYHYFWKHPHDIPRIHPPTQSCEAGMLWMDGVSGTKNTYRIVYSIHCSHYALNNTQVEDGTSTSDTFNLHISFFWAKVC